MVLRADRVQDLERVRPLAPRDRGAPFAVAPVEHQNGGAGCEPEDVTEVIALVALQRDRGSGGKGAIDEQAGGTEVEQSHVISNHLFR